MPAQLLDLDVLAWPAARLAEALEIAAQQTGLTPLGAQAVSDDKAAPVTDTDDIAQEQWLAVSAARLGIEAEPVEATLSEMVHLVQTAAPAILRIPIETEAAPRRFLVLLARAAFGRVAVLGVDLKVRRVSAQAVRDALCGPLIEPWGERVDRVLAGLGEDSIPLKRRERARQTLLEEQLSALRIGIGWLLRVSPGASLWQQARLNRLARPVLTMLGAYLLQEALLVGSWGLIGRGVLAGAFEAAWLSAWALILFSAIPCQLLVSWAQGQLSVLAGAMFKQRLLFGLLKLQPDEIRGQGMGQFLGRVLDSEAVEMLALSGGLAALIAVVQLGVALWVLAQGAGGGAQVLALLAWCAATGLIGWWSYRRGRAWLTANRSLTNDLVERMVGHRTRLAQEAPHNWHAGEDQELARYLDLSREFDRSDLYLAALPSAWLIVGVASLLPALLSASTGLEKLAISVGGVLLAYQAFTAIQFGVQGLIQLGLAWQQIKPIFQAASRPAEAAAVVIRSAASPAPDRSGGATADPDRKPLLVARNLSFRYRAQGRQVLHDCNLHIKPGDRVLVEGPSGGGKTTLAAILAGLRQPESGALLLHGYDRQSLGNEAWRQRVVIAPQFHENHIFSETFAFNLLLGRRWPPTDADLKEAETICAELGLGELLARMPAGWQQMVGENGWQLSHGERSRVFIARALLQHADLIIMDESFGALDPENLARSLACARRRAATLLVIAHP
ncbi:MAG: ABC transporter ATP-binding protein [Thermoflexales bacterium]|nr:ABC transporter ATP-binding protein [Thermoflexales bacterium]